MRCARFCPRAKAARRTPRSVFRVPCPRVRAPASGIESELNGAALQFTPAFFGRGRDCQHRKGTNPTALLAFERLTPGANLVAFLRRDGTTASGGPGVVRDMVVDAQGGRGGVPLLTVEGLLTRAAFGVELLVAHTDVYLDGLAHAEKLTATEIVTALAVPLVEVVSGSPAAACPRQRRPGRERDDSSPQPARLPCLDGVSLAPPAASP